MIDIKNWEDENMKFTENKINAIIEAYNQHLAVEFYYDNDYRIFPDL